MGSDGVIKITDFGIAWSASSVPLTGTGQVVGTAHYLSPEQAEGGKATPASDVYALGTVAYECLTGRRPFDGENSVQIALKQIREAPLPLPTSVPVVVRELVEQTMAKDPAARFADGAALLAAVDAATVANPTAPIPRVGTHGTSVLPAVLGAPAPAQPRRRVLPLLLGAVAALAVIAVVFGLLQGGGTTPDRSPAQQKTTTSSAPPSTVAVVAADLLGRPVDEVKAELVGRGLQVRTTPVVTADVPAGRVTAAAPGGELSPSAVVTLSYAVAPAPAPAPAPAAAGHGPAHGKPGHDKPKKKHG
jgi:serine/threonine-protein kinase